MRNPAPDASIADWRATSAWGDRLARITDFIGTQRKLAMLEQLLKHVEAAPADPRVRLKMGDVLQSLQRVDEAVVQYREAAYLLARRGFEKQARAVRALILRLMPGDLGAMRDLTFSTELALAQTQQPLPREEKPIVEGEDDLDLAALVVTAGGAAIRERTPLPSRVGEKALKALPEAPWVGAAESARSGVVHEPAFSLTSDGITVDVSPADEGRVAGPGPARPRERREEPRAHADGVVRLHGNGTTATGFLEDVSRTGIFVSGPRVFPQGAVVDVALQLPQAQWVGLARARVMRSVGASRRRAAGLGLAILWADAPTERWIEDFVATVFGVRATARLARYPASASGEKNDDIRRAHPRAKIDLPAVIRSADFEVSGWVRDLSLGGAFVEAPRVFGPGRRVELLLWIPGSYSPITVESIVAHDARSAVDGSQAGTGLRFIKLSDAVTAELRKILEPSV